jgi:hypothetical protein
MKRGRYAADVVKSLGLLVAAAGVAGMGAEALAQPIFQAYAVVGNPAGNQVYSPLGLDFQVLSPITITELGVFDSGGDGLSSSSLTVQVFSTSDFTTALASATIPSGTVASLMGGYRFSMLGMPLDLGLGSYSVVASGFTSADPEGNRNLGFQALVTDNGGGFISFTSSRYGNPLLPGVIDGPCAGQAQACYAAGSFKFEAQQEPPTSMPAPATLPVVALGVGAVAFASRRRRRTTT